MIPPEESQRDKRQHQRTPLRTKIRVKHESFGEMVISTRDISLGGVFLVTGGIPMPSPGTVIEGQVIDDYGERPVVEMEIVRVEPEGVGVRFLE